MPSENGYKTHYAYMVHPPDKRAATSVFDLSSASLDTRRKLVHELLQRGQLLARIPKQHIYCRVETLAQLKNVLELEGLA